ncbi:hypothetical protein J2T57_001117 [Natronocella acetinitrilica]|uniref:Uncharacterized protein n=1 Tax=Natronocella acetinitrilica TaxID=414046 RepID=A0AAE3G2M3_9GAMM|nr:hypothetical protein [Natronocella acetinitrilica]MCP1674018.1 hypothetical protein [Natronocella acetinitrilica]
MSTTIGLGYCSQKNADIFPAALKVATSFGYGLLDGIVYAEPDVVAGLSGVSRIEGWDKVLFLQAPRKGTVALAFDIHNELIDFEVKGVRPKFFDFLTEVVSVCSVECDKLAIFFAGEWSRGDRVRYTYGTVNDLISLLSLPGNWGFRYLCLETGHMQDSDDVPLVFDLKF